MSNLSLPLPSTEAAIHSQSLTDFIVQTINHANGAIPFAEFMALALYAPGLGYYSGGARKFGAGGDFVTAPEISPLFSQCLARQCQQVLNHLSHGVILEFGAGSGIMAADLLQELARLDCLPAQYLILEVSAELQQRQRVTLQARIPELLARVQWLSSLPAQPISGVILANEVLDAMPVQRFCLEAQDLLEFYVGYEDSHFVWQLLPTCNEELRQAVVALRPSLSIPYISEVNLTMTGWIQSVAESLETGLVLLCDYGFPRREYYHPQRDQGTLMCHYQHYAHTDPLILVGLQDITAHVDFTAVAEAAQSTGLQIAGYTTQAKFLLACGLPELLSNTNDSNYWRLAQQAKTLIFPSEMGELFKVMALTRQLELPLLGWAQDERRRL